MGAATAGGSSSDASSERVNAAGALIVAAQTAQVAVKALLSEAARLGLDLPISTAASLPGLSVAAAHVVTGGLSAAAAALQPGQAAAVAAAAGGGGTPDRGPRQRPGAAP